MLSRYPVRSPAQAERARRDAERVLQDLPQSLAFLGGSVHAGLGTPDSDVDLFVLCRDGERPIIRQIMVGDQRVDVEFWELTRFEEVVERCTTFDVTLADSSLLSFARRPNLSILLRFALGEIVADDGTLAKLQERANASHDQVQSLVVSRMAQEMQLLSEDVIGLLAIGDLNAAAYVSKQVLLAAAEAILARHGDPYLGDKWVWQKWRRTIGDRLAELRPVVFDEVSAPLGELAVIRLHASQDLLVQAATGVEYPSLAVSATGLPHRDPAAVPVPYRDCVLVYRTRHKTVRLSPQGLLLWGVAHGRTRDDAVELATKLISDSTGPVAGSDVDSYYGTLADAGLVRGVAG